MKPPINRNDFLWFVGLLLVSAGIYFFGGLGIKRLGPLAPVWLARAAASLLVVCFLAAIGGSAGALFKRKLLGAVIFGGVAAFCMVVIFVPNRF
jgi:hypothetical protein